MWCIKGNGGEYNGSSGKSDDEMLDDCFSKKVGISDLRTHTVTEHLKLGAAHQPKEFTEPMRELPSPDGIPFEIGIPASIPVWLICDERR